MGAPLRNPELPPRDGPALEPARSGASEACDHTLDDFSLVVGGPVYDYLLRIGLLRFELPNLMRRIGAIIAITWIPLLVLSLKDGLAFGHKVQVPLLYDFATYGRLILALPLLMIAEVVIDPSIRRAIKQFVSAGIVQEDGLPEFREVLHRTQRLRDSKIPELVLLAIAFFPTFFFEHEWTAAAVSSWHSTSTGALTLPGWWYAVVSAPFLRFMIYRWLYRYLIWSVLLWKIGRLKLHLMPTHPDRAAGLDFLSLTQRGFGIVFAALGCAFAGRIANSVLFEGRQIASFQVLMGGYIVLSLILGLLPLTLLSPRMQRVRKTGLLEYGKLANQYTESFDRKWVHPSEPASEALLGTADLQSLADLGNSYSVIQEMSIAPITKRLVIFLASQAALPLVPVIIMCTPTAELVNAIVKMVM